MNMMYEKEKEYFYKELSTFAESMETFISKDKEWTIKGFIDINKNIYTISNDTKIISKILELHLFPYFIEFSDSIEYNIELATHQNWYPDLTFVSRKDNNIKFAVDLKTTYIESENNDFCNGFTLGSYAGYFTTRDKDKNIQYPYNQYSGHFCLGIIYNRVELDSLFETKTYTLDNFNEIPSVLNNFTFFVQEKWRIASDKKGSGNTANIGSIKKVEDILNGNGVFALAGEQIFDNYWMNFNKIDAPPNDKGEIKKITSLKEFLEYRGLPQDLYNAKAPKRKKKKE